jgi:two-component system sensor histidine kinase KdpD
MDRSARAVLPIVLSIAAVAAVTAIYVLLVHVNPTTIALSYVVVILLTAARWGIAESTTASVTAVLCFNFFFLPPVGTFTIADPQNWVALVAFLLTAIVASQLSGRAKQRNVEALNKQQDLERLYALSRALLLSEPGASGSVAIARHIADVFELEAVGLYDQRTDTIFRAGPVDIPGIEATLRDVARRGTTVRDPSGLTAIAIQLGGVSIGSVATTGTGLSDTVQHSIANLAAIGLERARGEEVTARAEAARQSSELRATVLDALAHEFKTPLTSMKGATGELLISRDIAPRDRELVSILDEELERVQSLVSDAVQMLRIESGDFAVHPGRHLVTDLVQAALRKFQHRLDGHRLLERIPDGLTVDGDGDLVALAIRQLLDNALKYSPPTSTIEIRAEANGSVDLTICNSGSAIPAREQHRVLERFYRGARARNIPGTGMGLAIVQQIAEAHAGTLKLTSSEETGTAFTLSLPRGGGKA